MITKFALLSDIHLLLESPEGRLDNTHETQKAKMDYILDYCIDNDAAILEAGDFMDQPRSWHNLVAWLEYFRNRETPPIYAIYGQHDTHFYSYKTRNATALGILASSGYIHLLDSPGEYFPQGNIMVYGCSEGEPIPKPRSEGTNILVIHKMIVDTKVWSKQENYIYAPTFLHEHKGFDLILCGDCHRNFIFYSEDTKRVIVNPGPILRLTALEYYFTYKPSFYTYDIKTKKISLHEIPHKPADEVLTREHIQKEEARSLMMEEFTGAIEEETEKSDQVDFHSILLSLIESEKVTSGVKQILSEAMDKEL